MAIIYTQNKSCIWSTAVLLILVIDCIFTRISGTASIPCQPRDYGHGSVVCVCNSTYCDTVPSTKVPAGQYMLYQSAKKPADRFRQTSGSFVSNPASSVVMTVNRSVTYQTILAFGGAVTDAVGINILTLNVAARTRLLQAYFSPHGIEYTMLRLPIASCDFSTHPYSYDDTPGDFTLTNFSITMEDLNYKIPIVQAAMKMSNRSIRLFGSAWSSPAWMKTNQNMTGKGQLIGKPGGKYFKTWANYLIRFLQEYRKHNLTFWGLTAQNEPTDGNIPYFPFQAMGWTAETQRDWIKMDLGPALTTAGFSNIHLMIMDDQRILLPSWPETVLSDKAAYDYIAGIAVHWYWDFIIPPTGLDLTHEKFPAKFILSTEAASGAMPWQKKVVLGSWDRAQAYAHDIIQDLNHWVTGWIAWNLALNLEGGPNWVSNFVDSPVIVNASAGEFYKQPMYYALGHFSKFVTPGSVRVQITCKNCFEELNCLETVAVVTPDSYTVMTVLNKCDLSFSFSLHDEKYGYINTKSPARSLQTYIWKSAK